MRQWQGRAAEPKLELVRWQNWKAGGLLLLYFRLDVICQRKTPVG